MINRIKLLMLMFFIIMKRLLTSCFGLGYLPIAPGTWGSVPVVMVYAVMCYFQTPPQIVNVVMVFIAVTASAICIAFAPAAIKATGKKDPSEVVADEVAGQAIVFIGICSVDSIAIVVISMVGFLAFRLFDIIKPWPCRELEKLPKGFGILADDLMAGFYALIMLRVFINIWFAGNLSWLGLH